MAGASAAVGHDRGGALHDRFPVRVGHVRDQDVAGLEGGHLVDRGEDADAAGADALADGAALDQDPAGPVQAETAQAAGGPAGLHGFRACLQDVQAAVDPVLAPFDVHRASVVVFDGDGVPGELLDVVVGEAEAVPQRGLDRDEVDGVADFAVARVGHLERLFAQAALEDGRAARRQGGLVDVELVRVDGALDHGLAEAVGGGDEDGVLEPGFGVHREHHAGSADVGTDHALDARGERHLGVLELVVHAVGDGPVVVEGREDVLDGGQDVLDAADVQEGFLLPGEGGVGKILRRRAGADGPGEVLGAAVLVHQLLVGVADLRLEVRQEGCLAHQGADFLARCRQGRHVVGIQADQPVGDLLVQAGVGQEAAVGVRCRGEAVRNLDAGRGQVLHHLAEGGVLAAHPVQVLEAEF